MHLPTDDRYSVPPLPENRAAPPAGRVLVFAPHPDDECAGPGGALLLHRQQGDPVRVVVVTDGRAGDPRGKYERDTYVQRRQDESIAAMGHLDIDDLVFWGYPDDCVITDGDIEMIALRAIEAVTDYRPDIVYVPWEGEGHSDHRAVYCGVVRGLKRAAFAGGVYGYEAWNAMVPDLILDITSVAEAKRRALCCYTSQLEYNDYIHSVFGLNAYRSILFNESRGYGEAYRIVEFDDK